jgi:hypothetical protein
LENLGEPPGGSPVGIPAFFVTYGLYVDDQGSGSRLAHYLQALSHGLLVLFPQKVALALVNSTTENGVVLDGKKWLVKVDHAVSGVGPSGIDAFRSREADGEPAD